VKLFWPAEYASLSFDLPEALIAKEPIKPADHARLMVVNREQKSISHDYFYNLGKYLKAGDAIVFNATRVEERRVFLKRDGSTRLYEAVFLRRLNPLRWQVLMRNIRRVQNGSVFFAEKDSAYKFILFRDETLELEADRALTAAEFERIGEMPIPPYMQRRSAPDERASYQNFFKDQITQKEKIAGSAASPTAALHFTASLFDALAKAQVNFLPVCLDIGYATFAPLSEKNFSDNKLHTEHFYVPDATASVLDGGARKISLGTTSLRAILSRRIYAKNEGESEIFIKPPDSAAGVDGLITNFHLPGSSLILLTAAFCGTALLAEAYQEAIAQRYRFYSYGDAMLIL